MKTLLGIALFVLRSVNKTEKILLFMMFVSVFPGSNTQIYSEEKAIKNLEYSINVGVKLLPFYAVDKKGNPVYDLKQNELVLYINKKKTEILNLSGFNFGGRKEVEKEKLSENIPESKSVKTLERYVFIIFDKIFNSNTGINQSKKIINEVIGRSSKGDSYMIFELNNAVGLRYMVGPTKDKNLLLSAVKVTGHLNDSRFGLSEQSKTDIKAYETCPRHLRNRSPHLLRAYQAAKRELESVRILYSKRAENYSKGLSSLKNALRTITRPKLIYLITEGMKVSLLTYHDRNKNYKGLQDAAKDINYGDAMLFVMDSTLALRSNMAENQPLKYLAENGNGKYLPGRNPEKLVNKLKNQTAAYYELNYNYKRLKKKNKKIKVKLVCNRKGIKLRYIPYIGYKEKYSEMSKEQKKLFAFDVTNGNMWSRLQGNVKKIKKMIVLDMENNFAEVEIMLPENMRNHKLDVFIVNKNIETFKSDIIFSRKIYGDKVTLKVEIDRNKKQYIVLIEPETVQGIYRRIR